MSIWFWLILIALVLPVVVLLIISKPFRGLLMVLLNWLRERPFFAFVGVVVLSVLLALFVFPQGQPGTIDPTNPYPNRNNGPDFGTSGDAGGITGVQSGGSDAGSGRKIDAAWFTMVDANRKSLLERAHGGVIREQAWGEYVQLENEYLKVVSSSDDKTRLVIRLGDIRTVRTRYLGLQSYWVRSDFEWESKRIDDLDALAWTAIKGLRPANAKSEQLLEVKQLEDRIAKCRGELASDPKLGTLYVEWADRLQSMVTERRSQISP